MHIRLNARLRNYGTLYKVEFFIAIMITFHFFLRLEEAQNDFIESKSEMEASFNSRVREIENRERQLRTQLDMSQDQVQTLRAELSRRLELVKSANEAVVIKV